MRTKASKLLWPTVLLFAATSVVPVHSANWADDREDYSNEMKASKAICEKTKTVALPKADASIKLPKDCDATDLYYGLGRPVDVAAARACALQHGAAGADASEDVRSGPGILANIYANGQGVKRDYGIAIGFACLIDGAPAEMDGRIKHLAALQRKPAGQEEAFDVCQDITSGAMEGYCAEIDAGRADAKRGAAIAGLTDGLKPDQKAAFAKLSTAEKAFVSALSDNEVDVSGTGRAAFILDAQQKHHDAFLATLTALMAGKLPPADAAAFAAADKALNATYGKVMKLKDTANWGTVGKTNITATQRAWLPYRDAFAAFAATAAPGVAADRVKTDLTKQRTQDLKGFLD